MFQRPRGTKDLFGSEIEQISKLENYIRNVCKLFNYNEIRTPIFENTNVFSRSIGENTDIVNKEMYTFLDKGGDSLTLRPEMTAPLVRAVIENKLMNNNNFQRLWYLGPFFRYERPQKGRFRQFHQFGVELLGSEFPESDIEVIDLALTFIQNIGLKEYELIINTLGNRVSMENYQKKLKEYFFDNLNDLSPLSQERINKNPLRILDSKEKSDEQIIANAPLLFEFLDDYSKEHFQKVEEFLKITNVNYKIDYRLVRGLDYYSHTVFEFKNNKLGSQDSFGGGGRYNELFSQLGSKDVPAIGFAMGIERLLLLLDDNTNSEINESLYIVLGDNYSVNLLNEIKSILKKKNYSFISEINRRSIKSQFKEANRLNVKWTIVVGEQESVNNTINLKNMINSEQIELSLENFQNFDL